MNLRLGTFAALIVLTLASSLSAQAFFPPTPEELSMTSIPEVPGATAVILYKEETTDDALRAFGFYTRIKILSDGGKDLANIELPFGGRAGVTMEGISARTIHPDGTIISFTGKPYEKVVEKIDGYKYKVKVFTLPDVTVGSIIEYRYKFHYDDSGFSSPDWYVQGDLFVRKAHYVWNTSHSGAETIVDSHGNPLNSIAWTPILPPGNKVVETKPGGKDVLTLDIANIKPLPSEEFMPPIKTFSYRVLFYYTSYKTAAEYWTKEGKDWTRDRDKFIGPGKSIKQAVEQVVAPADSPDIKLHKIYAAVQAMENTAFTREHSAREDNASGLKPANSADDILTRKRGNDDQLAELFVAMARAAGLKAYVMAVSDRREHIYYTAYLSFSQLDDLIAIVNVEGKDLFFDPGQRYCPYGQLAWQHALSGGIRQTDGGNTAIVTTPGNSYKDANTSRVADLTLDEQGVATGPVTLSYTGSPALRWRQAALRGDETSLNKDLKETLEHMLPGGIDVKVKSIENLTDSAQPLKVTYEIKGAIGSATSKRLLLPASLFETNSKPRFPHATREETIDMHYPGIDADAVRFKLPTGLSIESAPAPEVGKLKEIATFEMKSAKAANAIILYRNVVIGKSFFGAEEYPDLRTFYTKIEAKDQETVIVTRTPATTGAKSQ